MYVHVRTTACRRWSGRSVEAQKNVENVSVNSFQIVAFEEDGWRRRCRRPFRPSRKDRSVARSPNSELFRTNGGKFVSFLPDEEAGPARPSSIRRLGAVWRRLHSSHARQCSRREGRREDSLEIRDQDLWAKDVLYHRSCYQSYTSPSTLKRLVEKELDEEAAEVSENARKKAFASLCAFITESILHTENVTDISQLCINLIREVSQRLMKVWRRWGLKNF